MRLICPRDVSVIIQFISLFRTKENATEEEECHHRFLHSTGVSFHSGGRCCLDPVDLFRLATIASWKLTASESAMRRRH